MGFGRYLVVILNKLSCTRINEFIDHMVNGDLNLRLYFWSRRQQISTFSSFINSSFLLSSCMFFVPFFLRSNHSRMNIVNAKKSEILQQSQRRVLSTAENWHFFFIVKNHAYLLRTFVWLFNAMPFHFYHHQFHNRSIIWPNSVTFWHISSIVILFVNQDFPSSLLRSQKISFSFELMITKGNTRSCVTGTFTKIGTLAPINGLTIGEELDSFFRYFIAFFYFGCINISCCWKKSPSFKRNQENQIKKLKIFARPHVSQYFVIHLVESSNEKAFSPGRAHRPHKRSTVKDWERVHIVIEMFERKIIWNFLSVAHVWIY